MGLFKAKGGSRVERKAMFSPFTMSRRLSNIAEENDGSDLEYDDDNNHKISQNRRRSSLLSDKPGKNKNTPSKGRNRFKRLVELEYGEGNERQDYEPPQDFLKIQKDRADNFYQNGPSGNFNMVKVKPSTKNATAQEQLDFAGFNIFQFAASTASLSKSCSSESSVCSTSSVSTKRRHQMLEDLKSNSDRGSAPLLAPSMDDSAKERAPFRKDNVVDFFQPNQFGFQEQMKGAKMQKLEHSLNEISNQCAKNARPLIVSKKENSEETSLITTESFDSFSAEKAFASSGWPVQAVINDQDTESLTSISDGSKPSSNGACIEWPVDDNFKVENNPTKNDRNLEPFSKAAVDGIAWPSDPDFKVQSFSRNVSEDSNESVVNDDSQDIRRMENIPTVKKSNRANSASSVTSFERAQNLFKETDEMFERNISLLDGHNGYLPRGSQERVSSEPAADRGDTSSKGETNSRKENHGKISPHRNSVFRNRKATFEKKKRPQTNPLTKIPSNVDEDSGSSKTRPKPQTPGRVLLMKNEFTRKGADRPTVSFRFEAEVVEPRKRTPQKEKTANVQVESKLVGGFDLEQSSARLRERKATPYAKKKSEPVLGAVPMGKSVQLFQTTNHTYDDDITKTDSFASTIDSSESSSNSGSSVSTYVNNSPRGIRGSFPHHLVAGTSSSLSSSAASSKSSFHDVDYHKRASFGHNAPTASTSRRPPTGLPPTSIFGSMLFQAGGEPLASTNKTPLSPKLVRPAAQKGVPVTIQGTTDDEAISDVTGSTAASEWMIQGNKLLNKYYYNSGDGISQKRHRVSSSLRTREKRNEEEYRIMQAGFQRQRQLQQKQKNKNRGIDSLSSEERNDPLDKMRRHQHEFQYPPRPVRSGFDNMDDDDVNSLFEA